MAPFFSISSPSLPILVFLGSIIHPSGRVLPYYSWFSCIFHTGMKNWIFVAGGIITNSYRREGKYVRA
jgi:hypothetical protein